uniref:Uncharacterized protein n=1 Tax=Anguilla anguilla TaxID=7936 RepID=A0A0E9PPU4_ANGAN
MRNVPEDWQLTPSFIPGGSFGAQYHSSAGLCNPRILTSCSFLLIKCFSCLEGLFPS